MKTEEQEHLIEELMRRTGKGKIACSVALAEMEYDMEAAIRLMKLAFPMMEVKP